MTLQLHNLNIRESCSVVLKSENTLNDYAGFTGFFLPGKEKNKKTSKPCKILSLPRGIDKLDAEMS